MVVRIVLADDHDMLREGLRSMLHQQPQMQVVGEAEDGREAVALCRQHQPDVVIMDITMPGLNGVEATRLIHDELPATRVIALSMHSDRRSIMRMLQAGARGYVLKSGAFRDLALAVDTVTRGQVYLSPRIASTVVDECLSHARDDASEHSLTPREREVLQLIAEGLTSDEIAERLYIGRKTVQTHRQHIMNKLGLHSVTQLTKFAVMEGLTSPEP